MTRSRSEQFAIVPEAVLDAEVPDGAKVLYAVLRRYSNSEGECWPSVATLAGRLGVSERTVKRYREALVDAGLLVVQPRYDGHGQRSNLYIFPPLVGGEAGENPASNAGDTGMTSPSPEDTDDPGREDTRVPQNESHSERETVGSTSTGSIAGGDTPVEEAARLLATRVQAVLVEQGVQRSTARGRALATLPEARRLLVLYPTAPTSLLVAALLGEDSRNLSLFRAEARPSLRVVEEANDDA